MQMFQVAGTIIAIVALLFDSILLSIQGSTDILVISTVAGLTLLVILSTIPFLVQGMISFLAVSRIPLIDKMFQKIENDDLGENFLAFYFSGSIFIIGLGAMFQKFFDMFGFTPASTFAIPLGMITIFILFSIWYIIFHLNKKKNILSTQK